MRVLVVEDDAQISRQLVRALESHGYVADTAQNGEDAKHLGQTESYDAIILDLGLPVLDGISVLQSWRQQGMKSPVLVLTARSTWSEKVKGLRAGADDYLAKTVPYGGTGRPRRSPDPPRQGRLAHAAHQRRRAA